MIDVSSIFKSGVVSQSRKVSLRAIIDITPVGIQYGVVTGSSQSVFSDTSQMHDEISSLTDHAITSEINRWIIGHNMKTYDRYTDAQKAFETSGVFGESASGDYYVEVAFSNVSIIQAITLFFPNNDVDGYPVDFDVQIKRGSTVDHTVQIRGNTVSDVKLIEGFTVYGPTSVRLRVLKWSLPYRRMRIPEIRIGIYDRWTDSRFVSFRLQAKSSFTAFSLPYTTCSLEIDNSDQRFDPTNKEGLFLSLEERQPITLFMSVNDSEFEKIGTYYHYSGGWKTGNSQLSLQWDLVDILGLLADRKFDASTEALETLPTTAQGWVEAVMGQLGEQFKMMYEFPDPYPIVTLETTRDKVTDRTCGDILCWICQALRTWPRALPNGKVYIGQFSRPGQQTPDTEVKLSYDNLESYPVLKANDDIARFDYKIGDATYSFIGTSPTSPNTQTIENPFIPDQSQASYSAAYAIQFYGGNKIETVGRGNPAQEVGDVVYVELSKGGFVPGRVIEQSLEIRDHILASCKTTLLWLDEFGTYTTFTILTTDGEWQIPGNLKLEEGTNYGKIKIVLVQAGGTGGCGLAATQTSEYSGENGDPGYAAYGGLINIVKVNNDDIHVSRGDKVTVHIGQPANPVPIGTIGGEYPIEGEHTTITINSVTYSSANGQDYGESGTIETVSAKVLSRAAQEFPAAFSGDGGIGGAGGTPKTYDEWGTPPTQGKRGAAGCVIICYSTEEF